MRGLKVMTNLQLGRRWVGWYRLVDTYTSFWQARALAICDDAAFLAAAKAPLQRTFCRRPGTQKLLDPSNLRRIYSLDVSRGVEKRFIRG